MVHELPRVDHGAGSISVSNGITSQRPEDSTGLLNTWYTFLRGGLSALSTSTPCRVLAVTNDGGVSPVGFVDLQPLVNRIDGAGIQIPRGIVYKCPYFRLQGGANAVILDPQVGDIGIAIFADRDISSVVANKGQANPGSRRQFSTADAMYIGGILNGTPTQWVQFGAGGITIHSPTQVKLDAPTVDIECETLMINATTSATITTPTFTVNGNATVNGNTTLDGDSTTTGTATVDGSALLNGALAVSGVANFSGGVFDGTTSIGAGHEHGGVQTGTGHTSGVL